MAIQTVGHNLHKIICYVQVVFIYISLICLQSMKSPSNAELNMSWHGFYLCCLPACWLTGSDTAHFLYLLEAFIKT